MIERIKHQGIVPDELAFDRLDHVAAILFPQYSRTRLQSWIKAGELRVDGRSAKPRDKVNSGDLIQIDASLATIEDKAENIPLDIIFEDDAILVVDKPAGLVVHPGAGNKEGTLLNALLHHFPRLAEIPRAGIVHRLDKETTGLMVVAKTLPAQTSLVTQLQARKVKRIYHSVVYGDPHRNGTIDAAIGRHPTQRTRMAVRLNGREAITRYRVLQSFKAHCHMEFSLETGRTHQIRVHMLHLGYPLVGDPTYGGHYRKPRNASEELVLSLKNFKRQALHAKELSFIHPESGQEGKFETDLPDDLADLITQLRMSDES
jgi:23S rRNA pseudouridine1911/1915/1917 synthase